MTVMRHQLEEAAAAIRQSDFTPEIGLILGSGLSSLADDVATVARISCESVPGWPTSTVPGHVGAIIQGYLEDKPVIVLQGRTHYYEGYDIQRLGIGVRVMQLLGIRSLIVTNAAGGINGDYKPGDIMVIADHINLPGLAGANPLRGPNDEALGPRFPNMIDAYDPHLRRLAHRVAAESGFDLREGTYAFVAGPSYETPAELRLLRTVGADAVGMSTVPEVIVARHAGIRVLGLSTITNMAVPDPAPGTELDHADVLAVGQVVVPRLARLIRGTLRAL
jgi:purine-nucleoside phosphorylase